jgi:peroxiredoxin
MAARVWAMGLLLGLAVGCESGGAGRQAEPQASAAPKQAAPSQVAPQLKTSVDQHVATLGEPAPEFSLPDTDGKMHTLRELRGKVVVLEWFNPDCPFVKSAHTQGPLVELAKRVADDNHVWLAINSGAPGKQGAGTERNAAARSEYGLSHPVLLDESGAVGRAYGATKTPNMFVIDAQGVLVYRGGLDNAPMGVVDDERPRHADSAKGERAPYLERALAELDAGRSVTLADTPPYGCSVKYAD